MPVCGKLKGYLKREKIKLEDIFEGAIIESYFDYLDYKKNSSATLTIETDDSESFPGFTARDSGLSEMQHKIM